MAAIGMMIGGAVVNALAFTGSNYLFSTLSSSEERKRHNLAMEKLQHDRFRLSITYFIISISIIYFIISIYIISLFISLFHDLFIYLSCSFIY